MIKYRVIAAVAILLVVVLAAGNVWASSQAAAAGSEYFAIEVVDSQTGRGVPLVELETPNLLRFHTDSNGLIALNEPSLMGQKVFFHVRSHGYEYPADGFGYRGVVLQVKPGGQATLKLKRRNIAERLYRITGEGIYRDSVLLGRRPPIAQPLLNGQVLGQDSVQSVVYRGRIYWFWGDTNRLSHALGHFGMAGATSKLPGQGGLDPAVGIDLNYFVGQDGFSRPMCKIPGPGMKWADGLMLLQDKAGRQRLAARCQSMKSLNEVWERNLVIYNDEAEAFEPLAKLPVDGALYPAGHPFLLDVGGTSYYYFPNPYPTVRVKADLEAVKNPAMYEAFTCLAPGSRYDKANPKVDRDAEGRLIWAWKANTDPVTEEQQKQLIAAGRIKQEEGWFDLRDVESGKSVMAHGSSVCFNAYRRRWIMITVQLFGEKSTLGEVWYAEADRPEGPWRQARQILTHDRYSFYNPKHHPFLDQEGGRIIYFEGTYTGTFSRQNEFTPRYDYNQIMYRLDLSDPRLAMPPKP